jgi:hypothetical protein
VLATLARYVAYPAAPGGAGPHPPTVTSDSPTTGDNLDLTRCPDPACGAPAEVAHRWTLGSTAGGLPMAHTICLFRHVFVLPEAWLPRVPSPDLTH